MIVFCSNSAFVVVEDATFSVDVSLCFDVLLR